MSCGICPTSGQVVSSLAGSPVEGLMAHQNLACAALVSFMTAGTFGSASSPIVFAVSGSPSSRHSDCVAPILANFESRRSPRCMELSATTEGGVAAQLPCSRPPSCAFMRIGLTARESSVGKI